MATSNPHFVPPLTMASGPDGSVTMINIFVDSSNAKKFIDLAASLRKSYLKEPECLFCEISQHPQDPGHIRVTQGWTRDSKWFLNYQQHSEAFQTFVEKSGPLLVKPRVIEHFNRVGV